MSAAANFLRALGHALDLRYERVHSTFVRAAEEACALRAAGLIAEHRRPTLHFSADGVRYGVLPLAGFEGWTWARLLQHRGIAQLEILAPPTPAMIGALLDIVTGALPPDAPVPREGLRWSAVDIELSDENDDYPLDEELAVMEQLYRGAERGEPVRLGDVTVILASLGCILAGDRGPVLPLLRRQAREGYLPVHALNTALLSMAVAGALRLSPDETREAGLAALLHDIGMACLPREHAGVGQFTAHDRAVVRGHPLEGARMLLRQSDAFATAAVVSYEHHLAPDGGGYPRLSYPREPHLLSRIVAVCDAFDALLAPRPDRIGFEPAAALREIERSAIRQFDPRVVGALSEVVLRTVAGGGLVVTTRVH